ncbi:globin-like protein [Baffinella frigidus]|nr:globin-like protein [Cryptophyta sp. CCMP2293]
MFLEIFRIAPEALKLFSFKDGENIADSPALQTHGVLVMTTVGEAVAGLKDMPSLVPILKELARRHSNFDVLPEHFPIVGRALMTTLETGLGDAWTPEVAMAWNVVWETIEGIMVPALLELRFFEEVKGDKDTKEDEESRADVEASKVESKGTKGEDEDPESKVAKGTEDDGAKGEEDEIDVDLAESAGLKTHGVMVMETVGEVVAGINTIGNLAPKLVTLAVKHAEWNVVSEHFPVVGQALLATLEKGLGLRWTAKVRDAWVAVWGEVVGVMEPALRQAYVDKEEQEKREKVRLLVEESWGVVEQDLEATGVAFFLKIFEIAPAALQLFGFKDETPLSESAGLKLHATLVMRTVGTAVAGLKDIQSLVPTLVELAQRHSGWDVLPEHFPVVGEALLWAVGNALEERWVTEVKSAWEAVWGTIVSVMEPALREANLARMSDADKTRLLVEESWGVVEQDLEATGVAFFLKIFEIAPAALQLFSFKDETPLEESAGLKLHATLVMRTVGTAVAGLKDIQSLVPTLLQLAERHSDFNVLPEHFPVVGEALLWTLEKGLGFKWTPEVKVAWESVWGTIVSVMEPALREANLARVSDADKSRRLVEESWGVVEQDLEATGVAFFLKIFEIAPAALQLFSFKDETPLEESAGLKLHATLVMRTVGTAVAGLKDIQSLVPTLVELAQRHSGWDVLPEHFPVVGEALLWAVGNALEERWVTEVKSAWEAVWGTIVSVMEPALREANLARQMPEEDRVLVRVEESWALVAEANDLQDLGVKVFLKIFEIAPGAVELFAFQNDETLGESASFKTHGKLLMTTVGQAVGLLRDGAALAAFLTSIAAKDPGFNLLPEHFPVVGQALISTLEGVAGGGWSGEVQAAWVAVWIMAVTVLVPALHSSEVRNVSNSDHSSASASMSNQDTSKAASMSNDHQIRALVEESWGRIVGRIDEIGVAFFLKVFEIAPEALQLFSFADVEDLAESPALRCRLPDKHVLQRARLACMVVHARAGDKGPVSMNAASECHSVAELNDMSSLVPVLKDLAARHAEYHLAPEHFPVVGQALLFSLEQVCIHPC